MRGADLTESTVTSKGQVTFHAEIRKAMSVSTGGRVVFTQLDDGTTAMRAKARSVLELEGAVMPPPGTTRTRQAAAPARPATG
jgi:antitoxin PrlF